MDLKELITFRTIVEEGTFSKAAEKLHYSQSTVTNQIQRLEKELGIVLFKRGWNSELTESGKIYANEVNMLINHWNLVIEKAADLKEEEIGMLRIGVIESLSDLVFANTLKRFNARKPHVSCHITVGNTDMLSRLLVDEEALDFAISGEPEDLAGLHHEHLYSESIQFIVNQEHELARKMDLGIKDLLSYTLVTGGPNCLYRLQLEREFAKREMTPFFHSISQISAIPAIISVTDFVGVVLSSTVIPDGVVRISIPLENQLLSIGVLKRRNRDFLSGVKQLFLDCLKEELGVIKQEQGLK
ncbi:LysR family transcriptional regulator [Listeria booriae]|uniref:LysR family transcriptional regulator n=1 Tax=Listeria booriae TaxID=1552123 RepID=A0A841YL98_9LIST|nr:LysR family transcriptional regulator [Listeria booriae]MBC1401086.1 LysR family transcriptional regulator [Listeria booriae]MBC1617672.1 LysR family transcriptional regulator [Listeria booriae]